MPLSLQKNTHSITGIDEAGRGALAGPVVAASVTFSNSLDRSVYKDSKSLSAMKRTKLYNGLKKSNSSIFFSLTSNRLIDKTNILIATQRCMQACVNQLSRSPTDIKIDGNPLNIQSHYPVTFYISGDKKIKEISAASIVAKVIRDTIMMKYARIFPQYNFNSHKGYGTKEHYAEIAKFGLTPIHRKSFNLSRQLHLFE